MGADGRVELALPSGAFDVFATAGGFALRHYANSPNSYRDYDGSPRLAAAARVEVVDRPEDVFVRLAPGARVSGRAVFEGLAGPPSTRLPIRVAGRVGLDNSPVDDPNGRLARDGSFVLDGVAGPQCLTLDGLQPEWHIERIAYDGQDFTNRPLPLQSGAHLDDVLVTVAPGERPDYYSPFAPCRVPGR